MEEVWFPIIGGFITAGGTITAAIIAVISINRQLRDNMDTKSGWRKELFISASKSIITLADIYTLRTTLRYRPYQSAKKEKPVNFNDMTASMISFCEEVIAKHSNKDDEKLNECDSEIYRIYVRYLLKDHWEKSTRPRHRKSDWERYDELTVIKETLYFIKNVETNCRNGNITDYNKVSASNFYLDVTHNGTVIDMNKYKNISN
ncbi:hypothetical protein ACBR55_12410 [Salinicoccus roseus]|uniref:hypothetical protein n=1 Tax=Salinicoccus roseus TaxID=45670 RepID=UPI00352643BF